MPNPQKVLGYASKSEAALALRDAGMLQREIALQLDVHPSSVGRLIQSGREIVARRRLVAEARRRRTTVARLRNIIIAKIVEADLFEAVLDGEKPL